MKQESIFYFLFFTNYTVLYNYPSHAFQFLFVYAAPDGKLSQVLLENRITP